MDLKPVWRYLGAKRLQAISKADGCALVRRMLTAARTSQKHYRDSSLTGQVVAMVCEHPEGIAAAQRAHRFSGKRACERSRYD